MTTRSMSRAMSVSVSSTDVRGVSVYNNTSEEIDTATAVKGLLMLKNEVVDVDVDVDIVSPSVKCRYNLRNRPNRNKYEDEDEDDFNTEYDNDTDTDTDADSDYVLEDHQQEEEDGDGILGMVSITRKHTTQHQHQHPYRLRLLKKVDYSIFDAVSDADTDSDYNPENENENETLPKIKDKDKDDTDIKYLKEQFSLYRYAVDRNEKDIYMLNVFKHLTSNDKILRQDTKIRDFVLTKSNTIISQYTTNPGMYRLEERPLIKDIMKNVYKVRDTILRLMV
jgi:hypothetical protein